VGKNVANCLAAKAQSTVRDLAGQLTVVGFATLILPKNYTSSLDHLGLKLGSFGPSILHDVDPTKTQGDWWQIGTAATLNVTIHTCTVCVLQKN